MALAGFLWRCHTPLHTFCDTALLCVRIFANRATSQRHQATPGAALGIISLCSSKGEMPFINFNFFPYICYSILVLHQIDRCIFCFVFCSASITSRCLFVGLCLRRALKHCSRQFPVEGNWFCCSLCHAWLIDNART